MVFEEVASSQELFVPWKFSSSCSDSEPMEVSSSSANIKRNLISRQSGKDTKTHNINLSCFNSEQTCCKLQYRINHIFIIDHTPYELIFCTLVM
jgi:hypothetical protein